MKRTLLTIAIVTVLVLAVSLVLVACGETNNNQQVNPQPVETEKTVTVVYHNNDETGDTSTKAWSTSLRNPTKKRTGYNFSGWTFDEEGFEPYDATMVEDYLVQSDDNPNDYYFDLWAQWDAKEFSVSFYVDNQLVSTQKVKYGQDAVAPSQRDIERHLPEGFLFGSWEDIFTHIVSDKNIYANLIEDTSVTVEFVGGTRTQTFKGKRNEIIPDVQDLSKAGYLFEGWFNQYGEKYERGSTTFGSSGTFSPRWSLAPIAEPGYEGEISLTYGEGLSLSAVEAEVIGEGITYSYAWLQDGQPLSDGLSLDVDGLNAGQHVYTLQVTATAQGFAPQINATQVEVNVAQAELIATIQDIEVHYGDAVPSSDLWTISYEGFVGEEDESIVDLSRLAATTDYQAGDRAGDYRLSADGIQAPNYKVTVLSGTLEVKPRQVLITTRKESPDGKAYNGDVARVSLTVKKGNNSFASEYADLFGEDSVDIRFATTDKELGEYSTLDNNIVISSVIAYNKQREVVTSCYEFTYDLVYKIFEGSISGFILPREEDLTVTYNGAPHSANVIADDCKIEYSVNNGEYSEELPEFTDVGQYLVRVRLSRPNYKDYNTRYTFKIERAALTVNATAADLIYGDAAFLGFEVVGDTYGTVIRQDNVSLTTSYQVGSGIGNYLVEIAVEEEAYPNFAITTNTVNFDVAPKAIEIKLASGLDVIYGNAIAQDAVDALLSVSGMIDLDAPFVTVSTSYEAGQVVGEYQAAITTHGVNANYSFSLPTADVKVLKRDVTLALTLDKAFNGQPYSRTFADSLLDGSFEGDTFSGVLATSSGANDEYQATGTLLGEDFVWNQDARFVNASGANVTACYNLIYNLKVTIANRFIPYVESGLDLVYDGALHAGLVTPDNEGATVLYSIDGQNYVSSLDGWKDVGLYNVSFRITQEDWTDTTGSYVVSIAKRAASITLQGAEITYGDVKPVLSYLTDGFVEGELALADIQITCAYEQRKSAGQYEIGALHAQMSNYNITINKATLAVQPKALEITLSGGISVVYGNTITQAQLDGLLGVVGLTDWDDNFVTVSADYSAGRGVGAYQAAITTEGVNANYSFSLPSEDIQVTKRALTLEVGSTALTYGDLLDVTNWHYSVVEGLYGDHEFDLVYATTYLPTTGFGTAKAAITAEVQEDEMTPNYSITILQGKVDVARRAVSIKVNDYARVYGEAFDLTTGAFSLSSGSMANGEILAVAYSTDYSTGDAVGEYHVNAALTDAAVNANYDVTLTMGILAVGKRAVSLKVDSTSLVYGEALDVSGWTYQISVGSLYGTDALDVDFSTDYLVTSGVGAAKAAIDAQVAEDATSANYSITVIPGSVEVTKRALTLKGDDYAITYGDAFDVNHCAAQLTQGNLVNGDALSIGFSTIYHAGSLVGDYDVVPAVAADEISANYAITIVAGNLEVGKKALTLTIERTKAYNNHPYSRDFVGEVLADMLSGDRFAQGVLETRSGDEGAYTSQGASLSGDFAWATAFVFANEAGDNVTACYQLSYDLAITISVLGIEHTANDVVAEYDAASHIGSVTVETGVSVFFSLSGEEDSYLLTSLEGWINVGKYRVYYLLQQEEMTDTYGYYDVTITKRKVNVTLDAKTTTYGLAHPTLTYLADRFLGSDEAAAAITPACDYVVGAGAGSYVINATYTELANYDITVASALLTVQPKALTISLSGGLQVVYGNSIAQSALDALLSVQGLIEGDSNFVTVATSYRAGDQVKLWTGAIFAQGVNGNYSFTLPTEDVDVVKRDATIKVNGTSLVYGALLDLSAWGYQAVSGVFGEDTFDLNFSTTYLPTLGVGEDVATISATATSVNYNLTILDGSVDVTKRAVTLKVNNYQVVYGNAFNKDASEYQVTLGSIVNGDLFDVSYSTDYVTGNLVGNYSVTAAVAADATSANYDITLLGGALTVAKRELTLAIDRTKAYNGVPYSRTYADEAIEGIYAGDLFSGVLSTASGDNAEYASQGLNLSGSFAWTVAFGFDRNGEDVTACYTLRYNLKVVIKNIFIPYSVQGASVQYDGNAHVGTVVAGQGNEGATITYSLDKVNYQAGLDGWTDVSTHTVYFRLTQEEWTDTNGSFEMEINKRAATITLDAKSIIYGEAKPTLTYSTEGFLAGHEALAAIATACSYEVGNAAGAYDITATYTALGNYAISVVEAELTVAKKALTISLTGGINVIYGNSIPQTALDALLSVEGLISGDSNFVTVSTSYRAGTAAGTHTGAITTAGTNANYEYTLPTQNVVVAKRDATIKANDVSAVYGVAPAYGFTATNLYGSDTVSVSYGFAGSDGKNVGTHTIVPTVAANGNYNFSTQNGTLTVTKASLTVTAALSAITYGDAISVSYSYSGFAYGESASVLAGSIALSCDYNDAPHAGTFAVALSGLTSANYEISYSANNLVVAKKALTLTINAHSAITYGDAVPTDFSCTGSGFVYGDTLSVVTVAYTCNYTQGANASSTGYDYNVNASASSAANYAITAGASKKLIVNKAAAVTPSSVPSFSGVTYNAGTLANYGFALGSGWRWANGSTVPNCATTSYAAYYNPNTTNYLDYSTNVSVVLSKVQGVITSNGNMSSNWTGNAVNLINAFGATSNDPDGTALQYTIPESNNATSVTDGGIYHVTITLPSTTNCIGTSKTVTYSIKAVLSGSTYYTVEGISGLSGTFILIGNAFVAGNVTISGTLTLPYDGGSANNITTDGGAQDSYVDIQYESTYLKRKLTIKSGTMTVSGTLNVGGVVNKPAQTAFQGATLGNYAQITVNSGANIKIASGGTAECYGYIKGDGELSVENGGVLKMPFVVRDFRGGSSTVGAYMNKSTAAYLFNKTPNGIAPFNNYEMPNVQVLQTVKYGGKVIGHAQMFADSEYHKTDATILYSSGAMLNMSSGSYITIKFTEGYVASQSDESKKYPTTCEMHIYGNVTAGSLSMTVEMKKIINISATVNTSDVIMGIPYQYQITVESGTTTLPHSFKLLPGSHIHVASGATLSITGSVIVYGSGWTDTTFGGCVYPSGMGAAQLTVAGTINVTGTLAGTVTGTASGAKVITGSSASFSTTSREGYGEASATSFSLNVTYTESQTSLKLQGGNVTAAKGKTYTYNGSTWS